MGLMRAVQSLAFVVAIAGCGSVVDPGTSSGVQIDSHPDALTNQHDGTFSFSSPVANSTFTCQVDQAPAAACTSPMTVTVATDGSHVFQVTATPPGGTESAPATFTWQLDTVVPVVTITASPPDSTDISTATFQFSADKPSTFKCSLDQAAATDCTSPQTLMVSASAHMFDVQATDMAGNQGNALRNWTVVPACTASQIEAETLTAPGWAIATGSVLHGSAMGDQLANAAGSAFTFNFTGKGLIVYFEKGPNFNVFSVKVDAGNALQINANQANTFTFQNPTIVAAGLPNAVHTAVVTCLSTNCAIDYFDVTCN
jgi:hypothetical protein